MPPIKLFIADTDSAHIQRITDCIAQRKDMVIAGHSGNGSEALKALSEHPFDLLITDVQLPGLDGMMLLRDLQRMDRCPISIVCTRFYSSICLDYASRFGASYVLYKPLDYNRLPEVIQTCIQSKRRRATAGKTEESASRVNQVRDLLMQMGLPPKLSGSLYLMDAMMRLDGDGTQVRNLSKGLYAQIAERMQTTPACVERALRTAIGIGYERGQMKEHFARRPSNRQFIEYLVGQLPVADE